MTVSGINERITGQERSCPYSVSDGLLESIFNDSMWRKNHPDYTHIMLNVFLCELASEGAAPPTEYDDNQIGIEWIPLEDTNNIQIQPELIGSNFTEIIAGTAPMFLGTERIDTVFG